MPPNSPMPTRSTSSCSTPVMSALRASRTT
jgi:hypothetical protein